MLFHSINNNNESRSNNLNDNNDDDDIDDDDTMTTTTKTMSTKLIFNFQDNRKLKSGSKISPKIWAKNH